MDKELISLEELDNKNKVWKDSHPDQYEQMVTYINYVCCNPELQCKDTKEQCEKTGVTMVSHDLLCDYDYSYEKLYNTLCDENGNFLYEIVWLKGVKRTVSDLMRVLKEYNVEDYYIGCHYGTDGLCSTFKTNAYGIGLVIDHKEKIVFFDMGVLRWF